VAAANTITVRAREMSVVYTIRGAYTAMAVTSKVQAAMGPAVTRDLRVGAIGAMVMLFR
jgi:hypothetical protein